MVAQNYALLILISIDTLKLFSANEIFHTRDSIQSYDYNQNGFDLDTSKAVVLPKHKSSPAKIVIQSKEHVVVENDGTGLTIKLNDRSFPTYVTGGPLFKNKYKFSHLNIHWAADHYSGAVGKFDGREGSSVVVILNFYKSDYGSYNNSRQYDDGLALISVPIQVEGHIPNPNFKQFADILEQITAPNSKYYTTCKESTSWLSYSAPYYFSLRINKRSNSGNDKIIAILPRRTQKTWISIDQFGLFLKLKNFIFEPLNGATDDYRVDYHTPLIQGYGFKQIIQ